MKDILDIIVVILFIAMLAMFVIGFNKQMLAKHKKRLEDNEDNNKSKDKTDD